MGGFMANIGGMMACRRMGAFSPDTIASLKAWYDASNPDSYTATGTTVTAFNDLTENGHNGTVVGSGLLIGTRTINGVSAFDFPDTGAISIPDSTDFDHASTGFTILMVGVVDNPSSTNDVFASKYRNNAGEEWTLQFNTTNGLMGGYSTDNVNILNAGTPIQMVSGTPYIIGIRYNPATSFEVFVNRTLNHRFVAGITMYSGAQPIMIGGSVASTNYLDGAVGEVLYFQDVLSDSDMDRIGAYLGAKWGVDYATVPQTMITSAMGQSNSENAWSTTSPYNADGYNAYINEVDDYFKSVAYLHNSQSGKPVMQISNDGNHWVNTDLTDGPILTQWKNQLSGILAGYGAYGDPSKVRSVIWVGGEGDTGQDENDFYDALEYLFNAAKDYTHPDLKVFCVIPGRMPGNSTYDNHQNQRNAVLRIINDMDFVYFGAEAFDLPMQDEVHFNPTGQATLHTRLADRLASVYGKRSQVGTLGAIITSATYSGNTITASVSLDGGSAISGSDVNQFYVIDDGSPVTINSVSVSGETITLTMASSIIAGSDVKLWCNYGRGVGGGGGFIDTANMVKDANGLPLRSTSAMSVVG